jgi:hypothetical protein
VNTTGGDLAAYYLAHGQNNWGKGVGTRDVTLSFRERSKGGIIGQMNYIFRIRPR